MIRRGIAAFLCTLLFAACGGGDDTASDDMNSSDRAQQAEQTARDAAQKLTATLLGEVQRAMKEGGPAHAVRVCAGKALDLTDEVAAEYGVGMRRVTEKPRNPLDSPDAYERRVLARFEAMARDGSLDVETVHSEVVEQEGEMTLRFLKPLTIKKPCLACHGSTDQISTEVAEVLDERYPADRATGYATGDLRGAISVTVPLER